MKMSESKNWRGLCGITGIIKYINGVPHLKVKAMQRDIVVYGWHHPLDRSSGDLCPPVSHFAGRRITLFATDQGEPGFLRSVPGSEVMSFQRHPGACLAPFGPREGMMIKIHAEITFVDED